MNDELVRSQIAQYTWYNPVNFGNGIVAAGNFKVATSLYSIHFGLSKWKYIIERNLPDLQGKRVMDIGCNNGIFSVQMAKMGASEVVGIDNEKTWPNWMEQAHFVKDALEWRCNTRYPIRFINSDMAAIPDLNLGRFDVVIALCCVYYLEGDRLHELFRYVKETADVFLVQCNTNRKDQPPEVHRRATCEFISRAMDSVAFPHIHIDKPLLYGRPVVVASNLPIDLPRPDRKIDRIRHWIRRKV